MNEKAGKKAVMYGKIGEDYAIKKSNLFRSGGSHDARDVKGNLFGMQSEIPVEIKSAQLFLKSGGQGQFIFTEQNHEELKKHEGYYIFIFMQEKRILFCIRVPAGEIDKVISNKFKNSINGRRKADFFRITTNFFRKVKYVRLYQ